MAKRKNAAGSGSIRKRSNGTWEARYVVGVDPATGKSIRRSIYGKTQKEVREKLRAATAAIDKGTYFEPSKMTVGQWLEEWLETYTVNTKPYSRESYRSVIKVRLIPNIGAVPLATLSAPQIQRMCNDLLQGTDDKPALAPGTVKNTYIVLHTALQKAVSIGYIRNNPCDAVVLPRAEKTEIRPFEGDEIDAFMDAVKADEFRLLFLVVLYTGMRRGEVLGLTWDCVDFDKNRITVRQQLQKLCRGKYYLAPPKNDKPRVFTVAPSVMAYLSQRKIEQLEQRLAAGALWIDNGDIYTDHTCKERYSGPGLVFTNGIGGHLVAATVYSHFKMIAASIGKGESHFHDLRHSFALVSLENGDDAKTVQEALGHATVSFTLDVYGHVSDKMREDHAQRMEAFIQSKASGSKG